MTSGIDFISFFGFLGLATQPPDKEGLHNFGNTCWFNSLIQTLFRSEGVFKEALKSRAQQLDSSGNPDQYSIRAIQLLALLEQDGRTTTNQNDLRDFITAFKHDQFPEDAFTKQEDVTEALSKLVNYLNLDSALLGITEDNGLQYTKGVAECSIRCAIEDNKTIFHTEINQENLKYNIVIPNLGAQSVQEGLNSYFQPEYVDKTTGNGVVIDNQSYSFTKTPYLSTRTTNFKELIITLPRFSQNDFGQRTKNMDRIRVDDSITLTLHDDELDETGQKILVAKKQVTLRLKSVSMHVSSGKGWYKSNSLASGHYTAYVRNDKGSFDYYNDSTKSEHSLDKIQDLMDTEGYLAVYEVVDTQDIAPETQSDSSLQVIDSARQAPTSQIKHNVPIAASHPHEELDPDEEFFDCHDNILEPNNPQSTSAKEDTDLKFYDAYEDPLPTTNGSSSSNASSNKPSPPRSIVSRITSVVKNIFTWNRSPSKSKKLKHSTTQHKSTSNAIIIKTVSIWERFKNWFSWFSSKTHS